LQNVLNVINEKQTAIIKEKEDEHEKLIKEMTKMELLV